MKLEDILEKTVENFNSKFFSQFNYNTSHGFGSEQ